MSLFRLIKILITFKRYGLFQIVKLQKRPSLLIKSLELGFYFIPLKYKDLLLAERLRMALENLGPVFVKFGQLLSTRPDLLPLEYIIELAKLQSQVAPFPGEISRAIIEKSFGNVSLDTIFCDFSAEPIASASIAQVHKARLISTNELVAIKVLRPGIEKIIDKDIKLLQLSATILEKLLRDGKRLRPREVVEEFNNTIHDELDFLQEAANNTELARLHKNDTNIKIPKIYYDYCSTEVIVMEWMDGTPIADIAALQAKNIDLEQLSHYGVEIFYTQVFKFGFFHADMHPGNILCSDDGKYIALDFGIVGCLSEADKRYLAINILAFFNRDYKKVAITHVESGWAPKSTSIEQFEHAIRAVCEPIFNKPLAQISFAQVLIRLFQVSRRFGIIVQPQLILLQKTIVNIEGLGRTLNPNLDLWHTAKPILRKWLNQQMGLRGFINHLQEEMPLWSYLLLQLPRNFNQALISIQNNTQLNQEHRLMLRESQRQNKLFILIIIILFLILFIKIL